MNELFESNAKAAAIPQPEENISWYDAPFIQFEQIKLNNSFRQYLETSVISKKLFLNGHQKIPTKTFSRNV